MIHSRRLSRRRGVCSLLSSSLVQPISAPLGLPGADATLVIVEKFRANRRHLVAFDAIRSFRPHRKGRLALDIEHAPEAVIVSPENARRFRDWFER